jgi:release factor glutamine methyltransferase
LAPELTIGAAQARARQSLKGISETPTLDVQLLLAELHNQPRAWVMAHPEFRLDGPTQETFTECLSRLSDGEPLAYVLGWWEFYGRRFRVSPAVLIPRPETEHLVETALGFIRSDPKPRTVVEVGAGSGCVCVTLALETPGLKLIATDVSDQALAVCRENVRRFGVEEQVQLLQADLASPLSGPVDLVLANLPYIPSEALVRLSVGKREPTTALDGGPDGLALHRRLFEQIRRIAVAGAAVILEIGDGQGVPAMAEAQAAFPSASVQVIQDLAGLDRLLVIRLEPDE